VKYEPTSKLNNSQVPPTEITLADLYLAVLNVQGLGRTRHRDFLSAIVRIGTITGRELNQIPLDPRQLNKILEQGAPGAESLSQKSLRNLRSDLAAAIAASGLAKFLRTAKLPLKPEWKTLLDLIEDRGIQMSLSRFARFCSALGISPTAVDDSAFESFLAELEAGSLVRNPAHVHRQAVWAWNKACRTVQSIPGRPVTPARVGRTPQNFAWEELPPSFLADYTAWENWAAVHDPYDEHARGKALKASTLMIRLNHIRSAVAMAIVQGTRPEEIGGLADLVEPAHFRSVLRGFHAKHGGAPNAYVSSMATTLVTLAKEWVRVPEGQLSELKRLRS
jgi:hypothetical protein